jgi:hypothetical protein
MPFSSLYRSGAPNCAAVGSFPNHRAVECSLKAQPKPPNSVCGHSVQSATLVYRKGCNDNPEKYAHAWKWDGRSVHTGVQSNKWMTARINEKPTRGGEAIKLPQLPGGSEDPGPNNTTISTHNQSVRAERVSLGGRPLSITADMTVVSRVSLNGTAPLNACVDTGRWWIKF